MEAPAKLTSREGGPALAAVLLGAALRGWQYAANPSIWVDEAALARSALDRSWRELLGPLDGSQMAPPGFMLAVKASAALLGTSELALRLVPFLAGILAPALFFLVARQVLRPVSAAVATFLFALAVPLVFFSANLKPYSSDVLVTLAVIGLALHLLRVTLTLRRACAFALAAFPLLFFSQAAVFPVAAAGAVLLAESVAARRPDRGLRLLVVGVWCAAVIGTVAHASALMTPEASAYVHRFWAHAFLPREGAAGWLVRSGLEIFGGPPDPWLFDGSLRWAWPGLFLGLAVAGSLALGIRSATTGALVVGPILLVLLASAARVYPFGTRVSLFLLPLLLVCVVAGADAFAQAVVRCPWARFAPLLLLPVAGAPLLSAPPPRTPEHLRPVLEYVSAHRQPGDALWVYYGAGEAFAYYARRIPVGEDPRFGACDRAEPREYLRQVDAERGRPRVWIIMAHNSGPFAFDERGLLVSYLDAIGRRLDAFHAPPGDVSRNRAEVVLYDLSDPVRLAATSAERFAFENPYAPQPWSCFATMSPFGESEKVLSAVRALPR